MKTHILTINEKKEKKKEGCMEKRAKKFKIQKTLEWVLKKTEKKAAHLKGDFFTTHEQEKKTHSSLRART